MPASIFAEEAAVPPIASVTTAAILFNKSFRRRSGGSVGAEASSLFSLAPMVTPYISVTVTVNTVVAGTILTTVLVKVVVISVAVLHKLLIQKRRDLQERKFTSLKCTQPSLWQTGY